LGTNLVGETYIESVERYGFPRGDAGWWYFKFSNKRQNAIFLGIECSLTFSQYLALAVNAGISHPSQIGRHLGEYQLSRYSDSGPYTLESCRFIPMEENKHEMIKNGGSARGAEKRKGRTTEQANKLKGRSKETHLSVAIQAGKLRGRTCENDAMVAARTEKLRGRTKETCSGHAAQSKKISKYFFLISPTGDIYFDSNIVEFCRRFKGLLPAGFYRVLRGEGPTYKGWWGTYLP
jgi:hypothetical protein